MKTDETNSVDYWKQVAKDAIDARDRMEERQRAIVSECERLRIERDKAVRDMGKYQEQVRSTCPDISDLVNYACNGQIILTLSATIESTK